MLAGKQAAASELALPAELTGEVVEDSRGDYIINHLDLSEEGFQADLAEVDRVVWHTTVGDDYTIFVDPPVDAQVLMIIRLSYADPSADIYSCGLASYDHSAELVSVDGIAPRLVFSEAVGCEPTVDTDTGELVGSSFEFEVAFAVDGPFTFSGFDFDALGEFLSAGLVDYKLVEEVAWTFYDLAAEGGDGEPWVHILKLEPPASEDEDEDGVLDTEDLCPGSKGKLGVDEDGCTGIQRVRHSCRRTDFERRRLYKWCVLREARAAYGEGLLSRRKYSRIRRKLRRR